MNLKENIRKILKEESTKNALINMIKQDGINNAISIVGDFKIIKEILNIETPEDYLKFFNDLTPVNSIERPRLLLYRYENENNVIVYDTRNNQVFVNADTIWYVLREQFNLTYFQTSEMVKNWIKEIYNISNVEVFSTWGGQEDKLI